jgi:DNA-binding transcriptional MerR regulator
MGVEKAPEAFRTISEVAAELDVPQHVLRFWETRFRDIKPMKRGGGRRYYRPDDVALLRGIRHLLYGEGYTIRGVQRIIREQGIKFVQAVWQPGAQQPAHGRVDVEDIEELTEEPDTRARAARETDRSRGRLLSLLPSLLGDRSKDPPPEFAAPDIQPEPPVLPARRLVPPPPGTPPPLSRDDLRRLQAALHELGECRRLLDTALREAS